MTNIVKIETKQPLININFEEAKASLNAELDRYQNVLVTLETLPQDKKLAQEINAMAKEFSSLRIAKVKEISAPIKQFESQMKELETLAKDCSAQIKNQVEEFEQQKLNEFSDLLELSLNNDRESKGVKQEFFTNGAHLELVKLTAMTKSGQPTKATKDALTAIVNSELQLQQKIEIRLIKLENKSLKAGLDAPLQRINVESFLFCDDEVYSQKLQALIDSEITRQEQAIARQREKLEREARLKVESEQAEIARQTLQKQKDESSLKQCEREAVEAQNQYPEPEPEQQKEPEIQADGSKVAIVTAQFEVKVPSHITDEQIKSALVGRLEKAGIKSLKDIGVHYA